LQLVFAYLISTSDSANTNHPEEKEHLAVSKARRYIEAHFTQKISLDDIANEACLSKFHLLRVFKRETGLAPITYQLHLRLNAARNLMFLEKSLTEIAHTLGFNDQSHFIHTYKKYASITPKELQKTAIFYNFPDTP
jgi:AraC-like DNA-binding protein